MVHFWPQCKDNTATLYDTTTLEPLKTYKSDRPINSAAISPLMDHVRLGFRFQGTPCP